ncbi:MAG: hypothetical protein U0491_02515 [Candidatus Saccharimonadales bacterium]
MSESEPKPSEQVSSSLDGIETKKLLAVAALGAFGLGAMIYKIAHDKLRSTPLENTEQPDEDL